MDVTKYPITPLTQQNIDTLQDTLEQAMKMKAKEGYPHEYSLGTTSSDLTIIGFLHQIVDLTK